MKVVKSFSRIDNPCLLCDKRNKDIYPECRSNCLDMWKYLLNIGDYVDYRDYAYITGKIKKLELEKEKERKIMQAVKKKQNLEDVFDGEKAFIIIKDIFNKLIDNYNYSVKKLSEGCGIGESTIRRILRGEQRSISEFSFNKIKDFLLTEKLDFIYKDKFFNDVFTKNYEEKEKIIKEEEMKEENVYKVKSVKYFPFGGILYPAVFDNMSKDIGENEIVFLTKNGVRTFSGNIPDDVAALGYLKKVYNINYIFQRGFAFVELENFNIDKEYLYTPIYIKDSSHISLTPNGEICGILIKYKEKVIIFFDFMSQY